MAVIDSLIAWVPGTPGGVYPAVLYALPVLLFLLVVVRLHRPDRVRGKLYVRAAIGSEGRHTKHCFRLGRAGKSEISIGTGQNGKTDFTLDAREREFTFYIRCVPDRYADRNTGRWRRLLFGPRMLYEVVCPPGTVMQMGERLKTRDFLYDRDDFAVGGYAFHLESTAAGKRPHGEDVLEAGRFTDGSPPASGKILTLRMKRLLKDEKGQALAVVALMMVVLLGFAALTIDVGMVRLTGTKMQNAADAAALAGAQELPNTGNAKVKAEAYGEANGADRVIADPAYGSGKIEVVCNKNMPYVFARVLGFKDIDVTGRAVALRVVGGEVFDYAIFARDLKIAVAGSGLTVYGNVHSNDVIDFNGSDHYIRGSVTSAKGIPNLGGTTVDGPVEGPVEYVEPPDLSSIQAEIRRKAIEAGHYYSHGKPFSSVTGGTVIDSPVYVEGQMEIVKPDITINGDVWVTGNVSLSSNDLNFGGVIYALGETVHGDPWMGDILVNGENINVNGSLIGRRVEFSGRAHGVTVGSNDSCTPSKPVIKLVE